MPNLAEKIATKTKEQAAEIVYKQQLERWTTYAAKQQELQPVIDSALTVDEDLKFLKSRRLVCAHYDTEKAKYESGKAQQDKLQEEITTLNTQIVELNSVKKALVDLKPRVKGYLMPSLNTVASNLLSQMTNGQRNSVYITEEFDILVDGQAVETLSGSGKAVVNLAIRIALGTVLTNKVFSVFLADEVDASLRNERSTHTAQCLRNLTKIIKQVIIISHKDLEVDHLIKV